MAWLSCGLGLLERPLERTRIDLEQEIAGLDLLAVGEVHLVEVAADAGPHLDRLDGIEAAGVLVPLDDLLRERAG